MQNLHFIKISLILLALATALFPQNGHTGKDMPGGRKGMSAVVLDDKILVFGGSGRMRQLLGGTDVYNPRNDSWAAAVSALRHARENAAAQVYDGKIYMFGGRDNKRIAAQVEMFDPKAGYWQVISEMPAPRFGLTSVVVDSSIWLIGGTLADRSSSARVDIYYPRSNRWERLRAELNTPRTGAMAAIIHDTVYVFGGFYFGPLASCERFDRATKSWQLVSDMPLAMAGSGCATNGRLVWLAGGTSSAGRTADVLQFNGKEWQPLESLSRPKSECAAVFYADKLFVFGGQALDVMGGAAEPSVEIFAVTTAVQQRQDETPQNFALVSAYPNPFAVKTTIEISLPQPAQVDVLIYDVLGRQVAVLHQGFLPGGKQTLAWVAVDASGARLPAGTYFVRLASESFQQTRKIFILN